MFILKRDNIGLFYLAQKDS